MDHLPEGFRSKIPNGGYPSQRKVVFLPCAAPVEDEAVVQRLRNLFLASVPQLLERLFVRVNESCRDVPVTVPGDHFVPIAPHPYDGHLVDFEDNYFLVQYDDGDTETMTQAEALPFITDPVRKEKLEKHLGQYNLVLTEAKADETNEYALDMQDAEEFPPSFFGPDARSRRKLCWETHNLCIFHHQLDECKCHEGVQVYRKASPDWRCLFRHDPSVCKCDREARAWSQDEAVYHAYILGKKVFLMNKRVALDKKSTGPGAHVSAACSEVQGEGFKPGAEVICQVNERRRGNYYRNLPDRKCKILPEDDNPFMRMMMIGVNRDGWWGLDDLLMQCEDVQDCLDAMGEDKYQHIVWFDQSVAHHRKSDQALIGKLTPTVPDPYYTPSHTSHAHFI